MLGAFGSATWATEVRYARRRPSLKVLFVYTLNYAVMSVVCEVRFVEITGINSQSAYNACCARFGVMPSQCSSWGTCMLL